MRKALALMISCGFVLSAWSQSITIKVNGNRNQKLVVDGKTYTINNTTGKEKTISITDLLPGQHSLQVVRNNRSNATTSFTTRSGYETIVNICLLCVVSGRLFEHDSFNLNEKLQALIAFLLGL